MKVRRLVLAAALLLGVAPLAAQEPHHVVDEGANPAFLFVISGTSGTVEGETLTLDGVPSVIYFSDRPVRVAGHMSLEGFTQRWSGGPDPFGADPPNAVLSILGEDRAKDFVLELTRIASESHSVSFGFRVLQGTPPKGSFGPASLFVDCTGLITPCSTN